MNKVILLGNLTRDPEVTESGGTTKVSFAIAVNGIPYTNKEGKEVRPTMFIDCFAWGRTAELIGEYFTKGRPILIADGELDFQVWEDKNSGDRRSKHLVRVNRFNFLPTNTRDNEEATEEEVTPARASRKTSGSASKAKSNGRRRTSTAASVDGDENSTEDIPF